MQEIQERELNRHYCGSLLGCQTPRGFVHFSLPLVIFGRCFFDSKYFYVVEFPETMEVVLVPNDKIVRLNANFPIYVFLGEKEDLSPNNFKIVRIGEPKPTVRSASGLRQISRKDLQADGPRYPVIGNASPEKFEAATVTILSETYCGCCILEFCLLNGKNRWFILPNLLDFAMLHDHLYADYRGRPEAFRDGTFEEFVLVD